jgi:hypothetical protein
MLLPDVVIPFVLFGRWRCSLDQHGDDTIPQRDAGNLLASSLDGADQAGGVVLLEGVELCPCIDRRCDAGPLGNRATLPPLNSSN